MHICLKFPAITHSLHCTSFTSLHFTSLHFTSLHFTSLHFTSLADDVTVKLKLYFTYILVITNRP
jgi:hypothetical protein